MRARAKAKLLRPVIAERERLYIDQLVEYALKSGFVRGQFHDMRGALNGFIEAIQELVRNGKAAVRQQRGVGGAETTGSLRETAPFCWLTAGAYAALSMNSIGLPGLLMELNEGLRFRFKV